MVGKFASWGQFGAVYTIPVHVHQEKMRGQRGTLRALAGICRFH